MDSIARRIATLAIVILASGCVAPQRGPPLTIDEIPRALLWQSPFPDLLVEVDYARDPPSDLAFEALIEMLQETTLKENVSFLGPSLLPEKFRSSREWSLEDLYALQGETRDGAPRGAYGNGTRALIHIVYLLGSIKELPNAVGLEMEGTAFVFGSTSPLRNVTRTVLPETGPIFERAILIHEIGHMFGLVDAGIPMVVPHADPESPHHSRSRESVMYSAVDLFEAQKGGIFPSEGPPHQFDSDDLADIRHAQSLEPKPR